MTTVGDLEPALRAGLADLGLVLPDSAVQRLLGYLEA